MHVKEIHKKPQITVSKEKSDEMIKKKRKEDERMIKGMFEFIDAQGGWLDFTTRFYPGEPIRTIHITHGEICDLPLGLVKHLNNTYKKVRNYDLSKTIDDSMRGPMPTTYQKVSRVRFTPIDVMV